MKKIMPLSTLRKVREFKMVALLTAIYFSGNLTAFGQDSNFYVFLSFGQSNMEGHSPFEPMDTIANERLQILQAVDCPNLDRSKGNWYTAVPPLTRCFTGITPADYFGKTLIAALPDSIRVGIINVSVGGCKIELFDKDNYESYVLESPDWLQNMVKSYDGNPYGRLIEMAQLAQEKGVIKGVLLHQGESNTGDTEWPSKVKNVYDRLLLDLDIKPNSIPLLAGELVDEEQGGKCASMNTIIATLPDSIPNAHVISSKDCTAVSDGLHFTADGYRKLGTRYGEKMLELLSETLNLQAADL